MTREEAEAAADKLGLSFWIYWGDTYVQDGGKRGLRSPDDESATWTHQGRASSRKATEEELEMWKLLTGLDGEAGPRP